MSPARKQAGDEPDAAFETLLEFLRDSRGFDFTGYKRASLRRRVTKRMREVGVEGCGAYRDYLEVHPEEFTELFNTILINVTGFFRDEEAWEAVNEQVVRVLAERRRPDQPIRVWCPGVASGEEAYTVAILLAEALGMEAFADRVKIYATDVDEDALHTARSGTFTEKQVEEIPAEYREKYLQEQDGKWMFQNGMRRAVIFGRHDLVQDAPISRLDLLVCRNTLMYFNFETQGRILGRMDFALNEGGFIFLGRAEMLLTHAERFTPVDLKHRIFAKVPGGGLRERLEMVGVAGDYEGNDETARPILLRERAMDLAPCALLAVDADGRLRLANRRAREWFDLTAADLGRAFSDLEVSYRPAELRSVIDRVSEEGARQVVEEVRWQAPAGETRVLDVQVTRLAENGGRPLGTLVAFSDVSRCTALKDEVEHARHELETTYEELQSANEELETTNEELQSSNEELETTNEELQSSNEEMETMNEELQATNEELRTMNDQLRQRTDEFHAANASLESVFNGLTFGIVLVNRELMIERWNRRAADLWGLREDEVLGRNLMRLDIGLPVDELLEPVRAAVAEEPEASDLTLAARDRRGGSIRCRVTIHSRVRTHGEIDGAVLIMEPLDSEQE